MHLAVLFTYLAASAAVASAAAIPKVEEDAKFIATSHGKQASSHYAAEPWLPPITGKPDPQWAISNPFAPPPTQAGDPSLANRYQAGRKDAAPIVEHDTKFDEVKRSAIPEAEPRWCGRPGEPCWVKRAIVA